MTPEREIRMCVIVSSILLLLAFIFLALGIISDALDKTLGLESMSWFLLAIFFGLLNIIIPSANAIDIRLREIIKKQ